MKQKPIRGSRLDITHPSSRGMVGCWLFNEGTGGKVYDLSFNENHGEGQGEISWEALGIDFNPTAHTGRIDTNRILFNSFPLTIVCVATYAGSLTGTGRRTIVSQRDASAYDLHFRVNDSGQNLSFLGAGGSINSTLALTANQRYFLAVSINSAGSPTFYRDLTSETPGGTLTITGNKNFVIGAKDTSIGEGGDDEWKGVIEFVYVWKNQNLNFSQIAQLNRELYPMFL